MKKILLTCVALLALGVGAAKAQYPVNANNPNSVAQMFATFGIPTQIVDQFDRTSGVKGVVPFAQSQNFISFFYTGSFYTSAQGGFYYTNPDGSWAYSPAQQYAPCTNAATGQPIYLKAKASGVPKLIQIRSDGGAILVFDTNGYYYRINAVTTYYGPNAQSQYSINFFPQDQ